MNLDLADFELEKKKSPAVMKLMAWSPQFETGIELIDTQHRALVNMINQAAPHLALNGDADR